MKYAKTAAHISLLLGLTLPLLRAADPLSDDVTIAYLYNLSGAHRIKKEWHVSPSVLEKQPKWDGTSGEPPLAVGAACSAAFQKVRDRYPDIKDWIVESIRMRNLRRGKEAGKSYSYPNVWYFQITFSPKDERIREKLEGQGLDHECTQVVLMDGTLVTPIIVK